MTELREMLTLALAEHRAGRLDPAEGLYRQILQANPYHFDALHLLGVLISQRGRDDLAVPYMERALTLQPHVAALRNNLGFSYQALGRLEDAELEYQQAIQLQPDFAMAHNNLGNVYRNQAKWEEAARCYRRAIDYKPDYTEPYNNLGVVLQEQGKPEEALAYYRQALQLQPDFAMTHNNLALALQEQGNYDEANAHYDEALRLDPNYVESRWNHSLLLLLLGDFERGWPEYEWRRQRPVFEKRPFSQPLWDGSDLHGRTILLYAEQGLGDMVQFIRYAPMVKQRGGRVIFESPRVLMRMLDGVSGVDQLVAQGSTLPAFDVQAPLLSLPGIFRTSAQSIPAAVPYLYAKPGLVEHWRREFRWIEAFKVGIAWQSGPAWRWDRRRSIPLARFAPLAQVEDVQLVSLQKGLGTEQLTELAGQFSVLDLSNRLDEESGPFMDTAAVMMNLDLVLSCDTAVPHLAAALGVPTWVALHSAPDWRWQCDREDNLWYPTMRLFRQKRRGEWEDVFDRMAAVLDHVVKAKTRSRQS